MGLLYTHVELQYWIFGGLDAGLYNMNIAGWEMCTGMLLLPPKSTSGLTGFSGNRAEFLKCHIKSPILLSLLT